MRPSLTLLRWWIKTKQQHQSIGGSTLQISIQTWKIYTQAGGAIVAVEPGITRDRTYRTAEFLGEAFWLVDTGDLVFEDDENAVFSMEIRQFEEVHKFFQNNPRKGLSALCTFAEYLLNQEYFT